MDTYSVNVEKSAAVVPRSSIVKVSVAEVAGPESLPSRIGVNPKLCGTVGST